MSDEKPQAWHRRDHSRDLTGLGWLEADVLRVVWDKGEVTVRDVYEELRQNRRIAYTTVMSVLRNLAAKGLLEQDKSAAAYVYRPKVTDEEVARGILDALVDKIMGGNREPLIAYLQHPKDESPRPGRSRPGRRRRSPSRSSCSSEWQPRPGAARSRASSYSTFAVTMSSTAMPMFIEKMRSAARSRPGLSPAASSPRSALDRLRDAAEVHAVLARRQQLRHVVGAELVAAAHGRARPRRVVVQRDGEGALPEVSCVQLGRRLRDDRDRRDHHVRRRDGLRGRCRTAVKRSAGNGRAHLRGERGRGRRQHVVAAHVRERRQRLHQRGQRRRAPGRRSRPSPPSSLSDRARYFAEMPALAPVRMAVIQAQSITARGTPVSGSLSTSRPAMYGSPFAGLGG